jgi:hypothetical protein
VNGICSCCLPAGCFQPAVAGDVIYADLWGELNTHLALQALFTQSSPVHEPLLQAFPFPSTLGKVTLHPHSQACMFIYSSCGKWVFHPLLCSFPPTATFTSFPAPVEFSSLSHAHKLSHSWLLGACPCSLQSLSGPPGLFIYSPGKDSLPPVFGAQCAPPSFPCVFICSYCLLVSFSFFPQVEVSLSRELCCSGPGLSVGVPWYREAHLVRIFPSHLGVGDWRPRGPPCYSV